jgi:hypothetical protein
MEKAAGNVYNIHKREFIPLRQAAFLHALKEIASVWQKTPTATI